MSGFAKKWLFVFVFCGSILWASAASSAPLDPFIEGAKREGPVTLGLTLRWESYGKPSGAKYIAALQKRYPFLKVNFKRIGGARERERVVTEMTSGMINYDVATVSETMVDTIVNAKLPRILDWSKLGVPKFLIHPKNIGLSLRTPVYGIGYNRDLVPDAVAKTFTWETCTDPKWKGKTAMDDRPRHLNRLYLDDAWGREKTLDYARRWAANKPSMESSRSTGAQKLQSGAYAMICGLPRKQIMDLQVNEKAANVGIVYPEPVPVGIGDLMYVPDKAKHPNSAILFMAWSGTKEAQNALDEVEFSGHPSFEGSEMNKILKGKKVVYSTWEDTARSDDILAEILQAMGFPVVR